MTDGNVTIDERLLQSLRTTMREAHERGVSTDEIIETVAAITGNLLGAASASPSALALKREGYHRMLESWCYAFHDLYQPPKSSEITIG